MEFAEFGSQEELDTFKLLQAKLPGLYRQVAEDDRRRHTVVVVPSLSLDPDELAKVSGAHYYEERLLYNLMLLRRPNTRLIFITSQPVSSPIVDYYLHLLSGVPSAHAKRRLMLYACHDASNVPLSLKMLRRPRLMQRIRDSIGDPDASHMVCFNSTPLERSVSVRLGVPLYGNDPALSDLGTKSGCREVFREAGILLPDGFERLHDTQEIIESLSELKRRNASLRKAVVKLNEGFSGEGNAIFSYEGCPENSGLQSWVEKTLPNLRFTATSENWEAFQEKFKKMGGVVEAFVDGEDKRSPSAQCRVNAIGEAMVISTHDQVLGGEDGQIFQGCTFPADDSYRLEVQEAGLKVARVLAKKGVLGRFATDFVSVREAGGWKHYAIEVNVRKGGTTHPFLTLRFLTDGRYDTDTGLFHTPAGTPKYYYASDTLERERYRGLTPDDLIDIAVYHGLHFHAAAERGVVFHLMGALSEFGKLGLVCIGDNPQQCTFLYRKTVGVLDKETMEPK
jgi:hypothetical protein